MGPHGLRVALLRVILSLVMFALGAGLFLYPSVSAWIAQRQVDERIARVLDGAQDGDETVGDPHASDGPVSKRDKASDPSYQYLLSYNQRVVSGSAGAINDPWGIGSNQGELDQAGLADALVGSVSIPSMGVRLPLYLGSTYDHMANGATVVAGTSAPLGDAGDTTGAGSNCVIAGHRGVWHGVPIFRDIEDVKLGDTLTIDTPWDTLTYKAVQIKIVKPTDVDSVRVQAGRDLVTLLTCHPYGHNYERYLVFFERTSDDTAQGATTPGPLGRNPLSEALRETSSPQLAAERWLRVAGLAIMGAMAVALLVRTARMAFKAGSRAHR